MPHRARLGDLVWAWASHLPVIVDRADKNGGVVPMCNDLTGNQSIKRHERWLTSRSFLNYPRGEGFDASNRTLFLALAGGVDTGVRVDPRVIAALGYGLKSANYYVRSFKYSFLAIPTITVRSPFVERKSIFLCQAAFDLYAQSRVRRMPGDRKRMLCGWRDSMSRRNSYSTG